MMSSRLYSGQAVPEAPLVGAELAAARERLGQGLSEMAAYLHIRRPYLEALERGRIADLPGNAYALAFLRSYAASLGLDPDEVVRRFKAEAADVSRKTELAFPAPMPERGLPAGAVVLLGLALAVGAYAGWYRLSGEGRLPAETVPAVPARLAPLAEQASAPAKPAAFIAAQQPVPAPAPPPAAVPPAAVQAAIPPDQSVSPSSAAAATPAMPASAAGQATGQPGLVVRASVDSWIQVRERGGAVLFSRILHAGESWPVPPTPNLLLTTGNAGGTELVVDGVATPALGGLGVVRRDLLLDADAVRSGKLAPLAVSAVPR